MADQKKIDSAGWYGDLFRSFERGLNGNGGTERIGRARRDAMERFRALGFPTVKDEEWKYTSVAPIARTGFHLPADPGGASSADLEPLLPAGLDGPRLVFVNGLYAPDLSSVGDLPDGVFVGSLSSALEKGNEAVSEHLASLAEWKDDAFTALSTAFLRDGAVVEVGGGVHLERPVHLLFLGGAGAERPMAAPRNLIHLGRGARAAVIETYAGTGGDAYLTNAVTEALLAEDAYLDHYKLGREAPGGYHVGTLEVRQARGSRFRNHAVTMGGALVRNNIRAHLGDEGIETTLNGVYLASEEELVDNHTTVDHASPNCNSWEFYKGILGGKATGVFNGRILVREDAQRTDAKQSNQGLLLGDDASINSKPELEIFADDVKCTHGATVGFLDEEALFYLRTRGFSEEAARNALTFAFANEIIAGIEIEPLRDHLEAALMERLGRG